MALGLIILRRVYGGVEYIAAAMLCIGVATFTLVDSRVSPKFYLCAASKACQQVVKQVNSL